MPDIHFVGLDSIAKKIAAVQRIADQVGLNNVELIADRAEALGANPKHREQYDVVTARAVAPLRFLLEYCAPFVKVGGSIVLWKSMHIEQELLESEHAQQVLGCPIVRSHRYTLEGDWGERQLLIFTKRSPLPPMYPREVGMAKKNPL